MPYDRIAAHLPVWLATPLSILTALAALAGTGCICAATALGAYSWVVSGLGVFVLAGVLWQVTDRIA